MSRESEINIYTTYFFAAIPVWRHACNLKILRVNVCWFVHSLWVYKVLKSYFDIPFLSLSHAVQFSILPSKYWSPQHFQIAHMMLRRYNHFTLHALKNTHVYYSKIICFVLIWQILIVDNCQLKKKVSEQAPFFSNFKLFPSWRFYKIRSWDSKIGLE